MSLHTCHNDLVGATLPGTQHVVEGRVVGGDTERVEIAWKPEGDDRRTVLYHLAPISWKSSNTATTTPVQATIKGGRS